ncbi:MAG: hypothetical protein AAFQ68_26245, partial [Bacteroidota bacterium]
ENIYVNNISQATKHGTILPQTSTGKYGFVGFRTGSEVVIELSDNWQPCYNEIIVHIKSGPGFVGFLAQNSSTCYKAKLPEYQPSISIKWGESECDGLESNDEELMHLTICNHYSNLDFQSLHIGRLEIFNEDGSTIPALPDGQASIQLVPYGGICFGDIPACSCVTRQFLIRSKGAKGGKYKLKISGLCFDVCHHYAREVCFDLKICQD